MNTFWNNPLNIVLLEPEIPGNTGTIGRLCVGCKASLTLIEPLGFSLDDKYLRRAGLDYWPKLKLNVLPDWEHFISQIPAASRLFYCSTKAKQLYTEPNYQHGDFLVFGKETKGLPEPLIFNNSDRAVKIPMTPDIRSMNLAIAVGIITYEAIRHLGLEL
ncbi:MAG: RNA methyltransferase [Acidobacteria bacterium]|nr:MAG: RNA methyltransferase [Acidobacteriota bacterium]